jgi:hippurate hydrolase
MSTIERIASFADELVAIRRDLHAHPEIGFEEKRTSEIVARLLTSWGIEVHRGIGETGVVGILRGRGPGRRIGLRADMDALPMDEQTNLPFASKNAGRFHGCGHDGHTTILLGAARYLAETRAFSGTIVLIFQPAEEGLGGARAMLKDKLFERYPCDEIYGLHNQPDGHPGRVGIRSGPVLAGADFFDIRITGRGAHGALPHQSNDPIVIALSLGHALQSIISRNINPLSSGVVSITQIHGGSAYNVIPGEVNLAGTIRTFDDAVRAQIGQRMREIAAGMATSFGAEITVDIRDVFTVLENGEEQSRAVQEIATELLGPEQVVHGSQLMGSEDFADMLRAVPGAYFMLGAAAGPALHNPGFTFDDSILPIGASLFARIAERRTAAS